MAIDSLNSVVSGYQGSTVTTTNVTKSEPQLSNLTKVPEAQPQATGVDVPNMDLENFNTNQTPPEAAQTEKATESGSASNKQVEQAVEKMKKSMDTQTEAIFGIHEGTNRIMIKIVDKDTKDVIKEFPPEKTLDMIQKVWEMAGIMVDEKR